MADGGAAPATAAEPLPNLSHKIRKPTGKVQRDQLLFQRVDVPPAEFSVCRRSHTRQAPRGDPVT